jgi:hypothetical protein
MKAYHNKGFGMAFFVVFLLLVPLPILSLWAVDGQDWVDRFTTKYFSPWQSECWETAKHERVCKGDKHKKTRKDILTDLLVAIICITIIGGMLVYAHFDIARIVNG